MSDNNKPTVSLQAYIRSGAVQERFENLLGKRAGEFTTSLMSAVNSNPVLQDCPPDTVVKAAIVAAGMNLPINPNLGFAYIIPYNNKKKEKTTLASGKVVWKESYQMEAQFQMGYKGFIQLAQRSNQFKRINASDVRYGEYQGIDRMSGEVKINWEEDDEKREKLKVVGYVGYFKLLNGFEKELYMSVEELTNHAKKYSQSFKKGYGLWVDQFDVMAKKTVLKLLISKYGALSTSLQEAILADQAAVEEDGYKYVDNDRSVVDNSDDANDKGKSDSKDEPSEPVEGEVVDDTPEQESTVMTTAALRKKKPKKLRLWSLRKKLKPLLQPRRLKKNSSVRLKNPKLAGKRSEKKGPKLA